MIAPARPTTYRSGRERLRLGRLSHRRPTARRLVADLSPETLRRSTLEALEPRRRGQPGAGAALGRPALGPLRHGPRRRGLADSLDAPGRQFLEFRFSIPRGPGEAGRREGLGRSRRREPDRRGAERPGVLGRGDSRDVPADDARSTAPRRRRQLRGRRLRPLSAGGRSPARPRAASERDGSDDRLRRDRGPGRRGRARPCSPDDESRAASLPGASRPRRSPIRSARPALRFSERAPVAAAGPVSRRGLARGRIPHSARTGPGRAAGGGGRWRGGALGRGARRGGGSDRSRAGRSTCSIRSRRPCLPDAGDGRRDPVLLEARPARARVSRARPLPRLGRSAGSAVSPDPRDGRPRTKRSGRSRTRPPDTEPSRSPGSSLPRTARGAGPSWTPAPASSRSWPIASSR